MRALPLLLLAAFALGGEAVAPAVEPAPVVETVPFRLESNGGFIAIKAGEPSTLTGGVQVWYGEAHLHADRLEWLLSPFGSQQRPTIERLRLLPGEAGWKPARVLIDTRACTLPSVGFRGVLTPASVTVERLPADPAAPTIARWKVVAADTGWFAGSIRTDRGWVPHAGWAREIELDVAGDVGGEQARALRFTAIHLFGQNAAEAKDRVRCRLDRLRAPLANAEDLAALGDTPGEFGVKGLSITIDFDDAGKLQGIRPGEMQQIYGSPPQDAPLKGRSRLGK